MSKYQIGQDIESLRMRVEALERKHKSNLRPLGEHEISDTPQRNAKLLKQHSRAIVAGMNKVLNQHGINLYVASFPALTKGTYLNPGSVGTVLHFLASE
jgi:hypothetical protein